MDFWMHELEIVEGLAGITKKAGMKIDIECFDSLSFTSGAENFTTQRLGRLFSDLCQLSGYWMDIP